MSDQLNQPSLSREDLEGLQPGTASPLSDLGGDRTLGLVGDRGELAALDSVPSSQRLSFPGDLRDSDHWICFRVAKNFKLKRKTLSQTETLAYIYLPVPADLRTGYKSNYANEDLGLIGELTRQAFEGGGGDNDTNISQLGYAVGADIAQSGQAAAIVSSVVSSAAGSGTIGSLVAGASALAVTQGAKAGIAAAGVSRNPHTAVLFSGVGFRSHSFNYKLVPRNRQESLVLKDIITAFKYYMAPNFGESTHFFEYPQQFDIDLKNERSLFDIGTSVLTDFSVNYHGNGFPSYFQGNAGDMNPTTVDISMSFQEVTITTKDEIKKYGR